MSLNRKITASQYVSRACSVAFFAFMLLLPAVHILAADQTVDSIEQRFSILQEWDRTTFAQAASSTERARLIEAKYEALFGFVKDDDVFVKASASDLNLLYRAASLSAFYSRAKSDVDDMMAIFQELEARKLLKKKHYVDLYTRLVSTRQFPQARELASNHPDIGLPVLPHYLKSPQIKPGDPTELVLSGDRKNWLRTPVDLQHGVRIIVISHPLCHFCQNAIREIEADPVLKELFAHYAHWLAPQDGQLDLDEFHAWNTQHPDASIRVAYKQSEWPMIDSWDTPGFYFLTDGRLVGKVVGWPKQGNKKAVLAATRAIGLLPSPAHSLAH